MTWLWSSRWCDACMFRVWTDPQLADGFFYGREPRIRRRIQDATFRIISERISLNKPYSSSVNAICLLRGKTRDVWGPQYAAQFSADKLKKWCHEVNQGKYGKKKINFRLAPDEVSARLTGYAVYARVLSLCLSCFLIFLPFSMLVSSVQIIFVVCEIRSSTCSQVWWSDARSALLQVTCMILWDLTFSPGSLLVVLFDMRPAVLHYGWHTGMMFWFFLGHQICRPENLFDVWFDADSFEWRRLFFKARRVPHERIVHSMFNVFVVHLKTGNTLFFGSDVKCALYYTWQSLCAFAECAHMNVVRSELRLAWTTQDTIVTVITCWDNCRYKHNAVSPIGLQDASLPLVLSHKIAQLQPDIFWLGGGEVDLKLSFSSAEFIEAYRPFVLDCTTDVWWQ